MVNLKIRYLRHELAHDQFCGRAVKGLKQFTSEFSVSCCYFEVDAAMDKQIDKQLKDVVAYGHILSPSVFIIVNILIASIFCYYKYLYRTLHTSGNIFSVGISNS